MRLHGHGVVVDRGNVLSQVGPVGHASGPFVADVDPEIAQIDEDEPLLCISADFQCLSTLSCSVPGIYH
jgi:hypothetical protein